MQERVTALFRKLELNGKTYYQCDFVLPEFIPNQKRFDSLENRLNSNKDNFFITGTEEQMDKLGVRPKTIFYEESGLHIVNNKDEMSLVSSKFDEITKPTVEEVTNDVDVFNTYVEKIYNDAKCHKGPIKEIVQTIVLNGDLVNSNMSSRDKYLSHDNIVLFGPMGSGKSIVLESLKKNLDIPTIELELSDDVEINRGLIVENIVNSDKEFNGHAVVLADIDFAKFGQEFNGDSFYPLKELTNSANLMYSPFLKKPVNMRQLTFIANVNVAENMLGYGDLTNYFAHISGCSKSIEVKRLSIFQSRKVLYESMFSALKFCEEEAKKYNREFVVNKKVLGLMIKYSELFNGNIMMISASIMDCFKDQLQAGFKKIIIGEEALAYLKGFIESETKNTWIEQAPENKMMMKDSEDTNDAPSELDDKKRSLKEKEELVKSITDQIKLTIKGQDSQVKSIVKTVVDNQEYANDPDLKNPEKRKANILIRGSSGTGKTEIIRQIASIINIPMRVEDATEYTEVGYVGDSAKDMLVHILNEAGGDIEKAERGIIVIDEIDKKANTGQRSDVTRGAVLDSLLKMIEGEKYDLDIKVDTPAGPMTKKVSFDTRRLTFVILGAFDGLDEIRETRVKKASKPKTMGFQTEEQQTVIKKELEGINKGFISEDYVAYGFTDQFTNRFDKKIYLNKLNRENLLDIMKNSITSPLVLLQEDYAKYGIEISYTKDFYEKVADIALTKKSGARSIKEVFEDLKTFIGFDDLELSNYTKIVFNSKCFDDPNALRLIGKQKTKTLKKTT